MRRLLGLLAGVLASVSLSGCWLQVGYDAGHTRHNAAESVLTPANAATLSPQWATELYARAGEPLVRGSRVYVVTGGLDGNQAKVDARSYAVADGQSIWTRTFSGNGSATFWEPSFVDDELWTGYFMLDFSGPRPVGSFAAPVRLDPADGSTISSVQDAVGVCRPRLRAATSSSSRG